VNGKKACEMVQVNTLGLMVVFMKENGKKIKLMVKESCSI
jgi:hypothetical protein